MQQQNIPPVPALPRHALHKRAYSSSTIDDRPTPIHELDGGAFKVIIDRPGVQRPKTAGELGTALNLMEIAIPSWKLGTPRFSTRGTAFIRGSSYATTEDVRSSVWSRSHREMSRDRNDLQAIRRYSKRPSLASPQQIQSFFNLESGDKLANSLVNSPTNLVRNELVIEPSMYDELTFSPTRDDKKVVRYSNGRRGITAATPPRLIAEITSPCFLDYELLSDFFLTYRSFLAPADLLALLVARLKWALARNDDVGMVVRVRAFVALRHWILNYFMDDFVVDYELRRQFCITVNVFVNEILRRPTGERNQIKILGELKKCWRRTCALYWDGPDFFAGVGQESPIAPGGVAGSREPHLTPEFWDDPPEAGPPRLDNIFDHDHRQSGSYNFFADVSRAGHGQSIMVSHQPSVDMREQDHIEAPSSPTSIKSDEAVSCSFPSRSKMGLFASQHFGVHPIVTTSDCGTAPPMVFAPKSHVKKKQSVYAQQGNGSTADSLHDTRTNDPNRQLHFHNNEALMHGPYAGSLVRGNLFPPSQPFVNFVAPSTPAESARATTYFPKLVVNPKTSSSLSTPGMKKLLTGVRRVLGSKSGDLSSPSASPKTADFPRTQIPGAGDGVAGRLATPTVIPQTRSTNGTRGLMRIDLLGAGIVEDFKKAIREDAEAEALLNERSSITSMGSIGVASGNHALFPSDEDLDFPTPPLRERAPTSGITAGSRSILVFDDTLQPSNSGMVETLPAHSSRLTHAESLIIPLGLTPPSTPPLRQRSSRRYSDDDGSQMYHRSRSLSLNETPSLVHDVQDFSVTEQSPSYPRPTTGRPSIYSYGRSKRSTSRRRYASYQSGFTRHQAERSFDATTFSDSVHRTSGVPVTAPLHILRRRPGGDLRAVTNVGDLVQLPLRRARSIGTLYTYSDSMRSSFFMGRASDHYVVTSQDVSQINPDNFSLGALASPAAPKAVSLFSTHSSQPKMRPSFEKEAAKLAQIPDDSNDDGGPESALLKLEGKFEDLRRSQTSETFGSKPGPVESRDERVEKLRNRGERIVEDSSSEAGRDNAPLVYRPRQSPVNGSELQPMVYPPRYLQGPTQSLDTANSAESYSSLPLLQRDHSLDGLRPKSEKQRQTKYAKQTPSESDGGGKGEEDTEDFERNAYLFVDEDANSEHPMENTHRRETGHSESFLAIDDDGFSDLSSELSVETALQAEQNTIQQSSTFPPMHAGTKVTELILPSGPLQVPSSSSIDMGQALSITPRGDNAQLRSPRLRQLNEKELPPTPEITPTLNKVARNGHWDQDGLQASVPPSRPPGMDWTTSSAHLPFILAHESKVLAQQFTLVEKDALNEIDWKELLDMRWQNSTSSSRSWVDFLRKQDARGVEIVISRFNIVCKWVVSECVLTRNLEERVQCVIKLIHIAAHCRTYRNFATLYQITAALTGTEMSRLRVTWSHIPAAELATLKELEELVQPIHNFQILRAEMENFASQPCIPFIGIYTHDLLFNSQRPSVIASTPDSEPLVNFEKCRMSAAIVKNLLRLLEASQQYEFVPVEGVTERCLWIGALSDEEIRRLGDSIE